MDKITDMPGGTCSALPFLMELHSAESDSCPAIMTTGTGPIKTTVLVFHIFFTIVPIIFSVAFSIVASRKISFSSDTWRFLLDFVVIVIPIIPNVTVCNWYVELFCIVLAVILFVFFKLNKVTPCVDKKNVVSLGHQPHVLTILRSTINIITAVCILAIDFKSFPHSFYKTSTYGVGLMDTGIGLFVFSMGAVSKPPRSRRDFMRLPKMVGPALLLGLARTVVIQAIDYHQDEKEYGTHLNAFFTLGLTKLFGALISALAISEFLLLFLGLFILAAHEGVLQLGLAEYIMDPSMPRDTFFLANREGICSLPGFIGIYLISMYITRALYSESTLVIEEYTKKVKRLACSAALSWIILLIFIPTTGISRRVCNFGYVSWVFTIALTMFLFYIILYDYAFYEASNSERSKLPPLMDATNRNGLVFFLVANILTGCVNIFLKPEDQGSYTGIFILSVYMLLSSGLVYVLLRMRIKIA